MGKGNNEIRIDVDDIVVGQNKRGSSLPILDGDGTNKRRCLERRVGGVGPKTELHDWWERANPWLQTRNPQNGGEGITWHTCTHDWRKPDLIIPGAAQSLFDGVPSIYSTDQLTQLARRGGDLITQLGGVMPYHVRCPRTGDGNEPGSDRICRRTQ